MNWLRQRYIVTLRKRADLIERHPWLYWFVIANALVNIHNRFYRSEPKYRAWVSKHVYDPPAERFVEWKTQRRLESLRKDLAASRENR